MRFAATLSLIAGLAATPVGGHPHIFVDTGFELIFDEAGHLSALRTAWVYDAFFTLLVVEDGGHDADGNGEISRDELEGLQGFDMDWPEGFEGDVQVLQGETRVSLGPPLGITTTWVDGRLISTHLREFAQPLDPADAPVRIRPFDPGYYTAYSIVTEAQMRGRDDCMVRTLVPDLSAMEKELQAALAEIAPEVNIEDEGFPPVGGMFAEEVELTCSE